MSERIAATESATSRDIAAPRQKTASSESNCFDANESERTAYFACGPAGARGALEGRRLGTANTSAPGCSLSTTLSKVTVEVSSLPDAVLRTLTTVFGNRM